MTERTINLLGTFQIVPDARFARLKLARVVSFGVLKRLFDLLVAATLLVGLMPVFAVVAVAIKIDSVGPVFFRQVRTGKKGKEFSMFKFRSMVADNDVRDRSCDDKYTRVGKFLRRTSIDELPQLINIVRGEMSFIGPRPWIPEYYDNMNAIERGRVAVRPGITGLAAASGRNRLTVFEKIGYDLKYVQNYSLRQDVKIVFMTLATVVKGNEVDAGKGGIRNDIENLKTKTRWP